MAVSKDLVAVLSSRDFGEYDKILTLFGRKRGKFSAIAKGVRRLSSRKRGHIETFNLVSISYAEGRGLDLLLEAESKFELDSTQIDPDEFRRVGLAGRVINKFIPENVPEPRIFKKWANYIMGDHSISMTISLVESILLELGFITRDLSVRNSSNFANLSDSSKLDLLEKLVQNILDTM